VSVCELRNNPSTYNHKIISIDGFVSHGFEDFTLFDPTCRAFEIWLEYGGKHKSDTMYCCGVTASRKRSKPLVVEGIPISLVDNAIFKTFDREIQAPFRSGNFGSVVHATLIGRFFSGRSSTLAGRIRRGYGHMGCCSLLAIQEIVSVAPQDRDDLDYGASADDPDIGNNGCGGYQFITPIFPGSEVIAMQLKADSDAGSKAFDEPESTAREYLASKGKVIDPQSLKLEVARKTDSRIVYNGLDPATGTRFMIVMSRPYMLTFYARDPKHIAWVPLAASRLSSCD
jgi:hypothetical protein